MRAYLSKMQVRPDWFSFSFLILFNECIFRTEPEPLDLSNGSGFFVYILMKINLQNMVA